MMHRCVCLELPNSLTQPKHLAPQCSVRWWIVNDHHHHHYDGASLLIIPVLTLEKRGGKSGHWEANQTKTHTYTHRHPPLCNYGPPSPSAQIPSPGKPSPHSLHRLKMFITALFKPFQPAPPPLTTPLFSYFKSPSASISPPTCFHFHLQGLRESHHQPDERRVSDQKPGTGRHIRIKKNQHNHKGDYSLEWDKGHWLKK